MRSLTDFRALLDRLEECVADELEARDLDFKHWNNRLAGPGYPERDRRMDWEAAKTRGLSVLMARAKRGDPGLGNAEIRRITRLSQQQVKLLMQELRAANPGPKIRPVFWPLQAIRPCRPKIGGTSLNG